MNGCGAQIRFVEPPDFGFRISDFGLEESPSPVAPRGRAGVSPSPKSEIRNPKSHGLPPAAAGVAVSPAACAATAGGRLWLGCGDPAAPLLRSDDGGISWSAVGGPTAVRELAAAAGAAVVLTVDPVGETDAIVAIGDDGSAVTLLDGTDLAALAGRGDGALRVDQLALSRDPRPRLCVLAGGRAFAVDLPEAGPTPSGGKDEEDAA